MTASNKSHESFCEVKFALSMIPPQPRIFTFLPSLTKDSLLKALKESHRMSPTLRKDKEKDKDKDGDGALRYTSWQLLKRQHLLGVKPTWEASRLAGLFQAGNQGPWQAENLFSWGKVRTTKTQLFNCQLFKHITRPYTNLDQWSSSEFQMQNLDQISALKFLFSETYWEKK